jgi:hypothetical protein
MKVKVSNMISSKGNPVSNQFIITKTDRDGFQEEYFQSYNSIIAYRSFETEVILDKHYWDFSRTTSKYRNQFLNETKAETLAKIKSGEYSLSNLN